MMENDIKITFTSDDNFIVYYINNGLYKTVDDYKSLLKMINDTLENKYDYDLFGYYEVNIYYNSNFYVLEFNLVDNYGYKDFDITLFINSPILYEYEDEDLFDCDKIYYNGNFYCEIENVCNDIRLFEYGNIIYGKDVDHILKNAVILN